LVWTPRLGKRVNGRTTEGPQIREMDRDDVTSLAGTEPVGDITAAAAKCDVERPHHGESL
jgi:hypothetical protein